MISSTICSFIFFETIHSQWFLNINVSEHFSTTNLTNYKS